MTDEQLTAIENRANAATREPWIVGDAYVPTASLSAVSVYGMGMEVAECQMGTDGAFIAAARVDVPALVAEVRSLRAEAADVDAVNAWKEVFELRAKEPDLWMPRAVEEKVKRVKAEAERDALRAVYYAAAVYCGDRTVWNEHALIDAVGAAKAMAVQP